MTARAPATVELSDLLGRRLAGGVKVDDLLVQAGGPAWAVRAVVAGAAVREAHWHRGELALGDVLSPTGLTSLKNDVLDRQVVDTDDRRVMRVGDVALSPIDGRLQAVALEVGLRPVFRRLGLRAIARRHREDLLELDDVTITSSCVIAHASHAHIAGIETHHLARLVRRLPHRMKHDVLAQLPEERSRDVRAHMVRKPHRPHLRRFRVPRA
ncbi:MAG: hypothetical protein ACR2J9_05795 [Gaiellales bacterium]